MHENFLSVLLSPMSLLFLINAFFLIFLSSFVWSILYNMNYTRSLFEPLKEEKESGLLLKAAFFSPVLLLALFAEYQWSLLAKVDFFPLLSSPFVRYNFFGVIICFIGLIFIKYLDKEKEAEQFQIPIFFIAYAIVIYLIYLIILIATVVTRLNAFPDGFLRNYSYTMAGRINFTIIYTLFLIHLIFVFFTVSIKAEVKIILLFVYTVILAFIYTIVT
ncbi:Uncharacterised protein [Legionella wadsworthii]|uniref:Uncharacterized protein n=1 Tax=Legionella wadsworthii TaxID=28088 RepID=A0A378M2B6_9GAMM|nr:hypothetical protein [Legionella wadsworthii]STY31132.1 Uncharacterised protein [Legionella wadsworthii]